MLTLLIKCRFCTNICMIRVVVHRALSGWVRLLKSSRQLISDVYEVQPADDRHVAIAGFTLTERKHRPSWYDPFRFHVMSRLKARSQQMSWTELIWTSLLSYTTRYWSRASASRSLSAAVRELQYANCSSLPFSSRVVNTPWLSRRR